MGCGSYAICSLGTVAGTKKIGLPALRARVCYIGKLKKGNEN